jgi:hypothetical protein
VCGAGGLLENDPAAYQRALELGALQRALDIWKVRGMMMMIMMMMMMMMILLLLLLPMMMIVVILQG